MLPVTQICNVCCQSHNTCLYNVDSGIQHLNETPMVKVHKCQKTGQPGQLGQRMAKLRSIKEQSPVLNILESNILQPSRSCAEVPYDTFVTQPGQHGTCAGLTGD